MNEYQSKATLLTQIMNHSPFNMQEEADKYAMINFMNQNYDFITRKNMVGHFTASAFVVNEDVTEALMVHHKLLGDYIYPGGHADGMYNLYSVALREVEEETGLKVEPLIDKNIFAIQSAPVKGHMKNGRYVPAHVHYDVIFVFKAKNDEMANIRARESENIAVEWWPLNKTFESPLVVDWARGVNKKIVNKLIAGGYAHGKQY